MPVRIVEPLMRFSCYTGNVNDRASGAVKEVRPMNTSSRDAGQDSIPTVDTPEKLHGTKEGVLSRPPSADANWAYKIQVAVRAREGGKEARHGKPAVFRTH